MGQPSGPWRLLFVAKRPIELVNSGTVKCGAGCGLNVDIYIKEVAWYFYSVSPLRKHTRFCDPLGKLLLLFISTYGTVVKVKSRPPLLVMQRAREVKHRVDRQRPRTNPSIQSTAVCGAIKEPFPCQSVDDFNLYPHILLFLTATAAAPHQSLCLFNTPQSIKLNIGRKRFICLSIGFSIDNIIT